MPGKTGDHQPDTWDHWADKSIEWVGPDRPEVQWHGRTHDGSLWADTGHACLTKGSLGSTVSTSHELLLAGV